MLSIRIRSGANRIKSGNGKRDNDWFFKKMDGHPPPSRVRKKKKTEWRKGPPQYPEQGKKRKKCQTRWGN